MKKELVIFGVGGILLKDGVNPLVEILSLLGKRDVARSVQDEYEQRKEKGPWGLTQFAELYQGERRDHLVSVATEYVSEQLRPDVQKIIRMLRERGYAVGAISAHPDFVMEVLKDMLELDFSEGTNFEYHEGIATGRLVRELNRNEKCAILDELNKQFEVQNEQISIVANSITQIPLIEKVGRYIAFNQHKELGCRPDHEVRDGELVKLLDIFQRL